MGKYSFYGISAVASVFLAGSCIHYEYDISVPFDSSSTILMNSTLPIGNIKPIVLKEIMFGDTQPDVLSEDAEGNLSYVFKGEPVGYSVDLPLLSFENIVTSGTVLVHLPSFDFPSLPVPGVVFPSGGYALPADRTVFPLKMESQGIAAEITALKRAVVNSAISFSCSYAGLPVSRIVIAKGSKIRLPQFVELSGIPDGFVLNDRNELVFAGDCCVDADKGFSVNVGVSAIDFRKMKDGQGLVRPGFFSLEDEIALDLRIFVRGDDITGPVAGEPLVRLNADIANIDIVSLEARLEPDINVEIPPVRLDNLQELFGGRDYVLDTRGLRLDIAADNQFPLGADFSASFVSYMPDGSAAEAKIGPVDISPAALTGFSFSESGAGAADGMQGVAVPGFDKLAFKAPEYIAVEDLQVSTGKEFCEMTLGRSYSFSIDYSVKVPLVFGPAFNVTFEQDIPYSSENSGKMSNRFVLNMKAVSTIPVNMDVSAVGLDANGMPVKDVDIKCSSVVAAGSLSSPAESDLTLEISDVDASLATIRLYLDMKGPGRENAVFNSNQSLTLKNVTITFPDGVTL